MMKISELRQICLGLSASLLLCSCDSKDPALEEETTKLKQENISLKERLKAAEDRVQSGSQSSRAEVEQVQAQLQEAQAKLKEIEARFDRRRLEQSFAGAVSDFKQETLKKFPGSTITQVTMHEMVMPSDHPFSSGLTMKLRDGETGTNKDIHVKALGNLEGQWTFQKVAASKLAENKPDTGAPPTSAPAPAPSLGGKPVAGGPKPPTPPAKPPRTPGGRAVSSSGGKVYHIDWGD